MSGKKVRKARSSDKKTKLFAHCEMDEVRRFLMPDASPKKTKKNDVSVEWVPCPLVPGTPETPPPRILQPWELKEKRNIANIKGAVTASTSECQTPKPARPRSPRLTMFPPSTGIKDHVSNDQVVDGEVKLIGFFLSDPASPIPDASSPPGSSRPVSPMSPNPASPIPDASSLPGSSRPLSPMSPNPASPIPDASSLPGSSRPLSPMSPSLLLDYDEEIDKTTQLWESPTGQNPGSDIDDADEYIDLSNPIVFQNDLQLQEVPPELSSAIEALDKADDTALKSLAPDDMLNFVWSREPNVFQGQREVFTGLAGPTFKVEGLSPFQIFAKIWDEDIISLIVQETNKYAENIKNQPELKINASINTWVPLTAEELMVFFAIIMFQGIIPLPLEREYWRPRYDYLKIGRFEDMMPYLRFLSIKRYLHFVDNSTISSSTNTPHELAKILPVYNYLNNKFSSLYLPEQNITIDESLFMWKGRSPFAQLTNTKASRVGIKIYELCESQTGYLWKMMLHAGKRQKLLDEGGEASHKPGAESATSKIVFDLVRPLLNRGHTLVMDNFYNSPLLSRMLKLRKTDTMGTLRLNREFVPSSLKAMTKSQMTLGEVVFNYTRDLSIVVSNVGSFISTYHPENVDGKEKYGTFKYKPQVVLDYNLFMGGIAKKDQLLQAFPLDRVRNLVWYKKLFRRLLNVSILNAHIIFCGGATCLSSRDFRSRLADEILIKFRPRVTSIPSVKDPSMQYHFPDKNLNKKSRCRLCYANGLQSRTVWKCETCNVSLCMPVCFKEYHCPK